MRLNVMALAVTVGLIWCLAILIVALANLAWPSYGGAFLAMAASVYPGYSPGTGMGSVITGSLYALVDGTIGGAIFAWLYNFVSRRCPGAAA